MMSNVVDLLSLLPHRVRDTRLIALHRRFGTSTVFSVFDAAEVLDLPLPEVWSLLFNQQIGDDAVRVNIESGGFRLHPTPPLKAALMAWRDRYLPILRSLPQPFSAQDFATAASIPYPTGNFLLSTFMQHDLVRQSFTGDAALWRVKPRPRVIMQAERPRRVIYTGH